MFKSPKSRSKANWLFKNRSYFLTKCICTLCFVLTLCAFSLYACYINIRNQRDEARELSRKRTYKSGDLRTKLRDTLEELSRANEKLQDADSDMSQERAEFRGTTQRLSDQHQIDQDRINALGQDLWNTESDRDEYSRKVVQASIENTGVRRELSEASNQRILAQAEVQTLRENLSEARRQRDLAQGEVQALSTQTQPQQAQATSVVTTLQPRPKPKHRRIQRPSSLPKAHKKVLFKGSKTSTPSTLSSAEPKQPGNVIADNLAIGMLQATLAERDQTFQAGAEARQTVEEATPEVLDLEASITTKDQRIGGLEQENGRLTADNAALSTDLETQLAEKNEEIRSLRVEKTKAKDESAEAIDNLRTKLEEKEKNVADLEEANATLVAEEAPSADATKRLHTLSSELEESRRAHAQCDENRTRQSSRIGELVTDKEQLEEALRSKNNEIESLGQQTTRLHKDLEKLKETHARCSERVSTQAMEITALRNTNGILQGTNANLLQQLGNYSNLTQEHESLQNRFEELRQAGQNLQSSSQREALSLQGQINDMTQTVNDQRQQIHSLETACPRCQRLREALDVVQKDVDMSDDETKAKMVREITETVRVQLRAQVPDDLRRQIRSELERQFQDHFRDVLASNSKRLKEQDRLILEKDAKLERKNAPAVNHAACERKEANLQSRIDKLQQDAEISKANFTRLSNGAKHDRDQLRDAQMVTKDLMSQLDKIGEDQRRAQNINPLQGKLQRSQRELGEMKVERDRARDNCSTYSKQLSTLRAEHGKLKTSSGGDSMMADGRTEESIATVDEQREVIGTRQNNNVQSQAMGNRDALLVDSGEQQRPEESVREDQSSAGQAMNRDGNVALDLLRHQVNVPEARDGTTRADGSAEERSAQDSDELASTPASTPLSRFRRRPTRQSMTMPIHGGVGKKRGHHEFSDGEADDEGIDDRKKPKRDGVHRLPEDKDMQ